VISIANFIAHGNDGNRANFHSHRQTKSRVLAPIIYKCKFHHVRLSRCGLSCIRAELRMLVTHL